METPTPPNPQLTELEFFEPLVGTRFEIIGICRGDALERVEPLERTRVATLIEAQASAGARGRESFRQPFELLFKLEPSPGVPQGNYALTHPDAGDVKLFLVPVLPDFVGNVLLASYLN